MRCINQKQFFIKILITTIISILNLNYSYAIKKSKLIERFSISSSYNLNNNIRLNYKNERNSIYSKYAKNLEFGIYYNFLNKYKIKYNVGILYGLNTTRYTFSIATNNSRINDTFNSNNENYLKLTNEFYYNIFKREKYKINIGVGFNLKYSQSTLSTLSISTTDNNNNSELLLYNELHFNPEDELIKTSSLILENEFQLNKLRFSVSTIIDYSFNDKINNTIIFNPNSVNQDIYKSSVNNRLTLGIRIIYFF